MSLFKQKVELGIAEAELLLQKKLNRFPPLIKWLIILVIIGLLPAFYVTKKISFNYWQKKYSILQISGKPSFENPLDVKINKEIVFTAGINTYAAFAEIINENLELCAKEISYRFHFFDLKNQEVTNLDGEISGKTFLLPNQTKYIMAPRIISQDYIASVKLEVIKKPLWQKKLNIPKVKLITSLPNFYNQNDPPAFIVEGNVQNSSPYRLKQIRLNFLIFNNLKQVLAISQRDEFDLKPFERRTYKQLWPNLKFNNVTNVKVTAETNVLDSSNLQLETQPAGSASDLSRPETEEY